MRGRTPTSQVILTDLIERAAIRAATLLQHLITEDSLFQRIENFAGFGVLRFVRESGERLLLQLIDQVIAFELAVFLGVESIAEFRPDSSRNLVEHGPH